MRCVCYVGTTMAILIVGAVGVFGGYRWAQHELWRERPRHAVAVVYPLGQRRVTGIVTFSEEKSGVRVVADFQNLTPGKHGFHIHEQGDSRCTDGMCTGAHFNPYHRPHGDRAGTERHVGDFGNLEADAMGIAHLDCIVPDLKLYGRASIIGRAVIVHADPDDLVSQPSGNSGARIGCGVIGTAE